MRKALMTAMSLMLTGAVFGISVPADAAMQGANKAEKRFARLDTNGNGVLDRGEFARSSKKRFKKLDSNGDGYVTDDELAERIKKRVAKRRKLTDKRIRKLEARAEKKLARLDADGDGRVSEGEFLKRPHPMLRRGDANGDGVLSKSEFTAAIEERRARRAAKRK